MDRGNLIKINYLLYLFYIIYIVYMSAITTDEILSIQETILNSAAEDYGNQLQVSTDSGVKDYIDKMFQLDTSANYLSTKKGQLQDIIGKNKYKKQIILLLVILIVVLVLLLTFIIFLNKK